MEQHLAGSFLPYIDAVSGSRKGATRQVEIPIGHAVSLPLPTRRFGIPAYAAFASPAIREPEKPLHQAPPDRWWLLDARSGVVALFAMCGIHHFANESFVPVVLPQPVGTIAELRQQLNDIQSDLGMLAPQFFSGKDGQPEVRERLHAALKARIPDALWGQYEALVPDFLAWLLNRH